MRRRRRSLRPFPTRTNGSGEVTLDAEFSSQRDKIRNLRAVSSGN